MNMVKMVMAKSINAATDDDAMRLYFVAPLMQALETPGSSQLNTFSLLFRVGVNFDFRLFLVTKLNSKVNFHKLFHRLSSAEGHK